MYWHHSQYSSAVYYEENEMNLAGVNIYTIIAALVAAALLFHFTSQEETIIGILAVVAIFYMTR